MEKTNLIDTNAIMEKYLKKLDWTVKENSNMSFSLQGLNNHIASKVSSNYWLNEVYTPEIKEAHKSGDLHLHDLQLLAPYCAGWDLMDLLLRGFRGAPGKIESAPPKHFRAALGQVVNFFYTLQGEIAGAQAFSNFDTYLAPFIRYDGLDKITVRQALQEFLFNINVPTRVGFQCPFTNVTLDLVPSKSISGQSVIIGGKPQKECYGDFQKEMDMFNTVFAELMTEGDAGGRIFSFPIPTYNIIKDFDWDSPVAKKIFEMTAKYGVPYFSNFINSDMDPDDVRSMCCRLRLSNRELRRRGGGLFGANPQTGSVGVVTLNLPRLGYLSADEKEFFSRLELLMGVARKSLEIKRDFIEKFTEGGLYPYAKYYLGNIKERFNGYWRNHFSTIGVIGMNEALLNFKPIKDTIASPSGREFALKTLGFIREKIMDFQNETDNLYNLEATPAEGTSTRLAMVDREKYPDIIVANYGLVELGASPYYTNSTHLPVDFTDDLFGALDLQDELQIQYTGGTVFHGFFGEALPSGKAVASLVKTITKKYRMPYFTFTPTFSVCPSHGYISGEKMRCPQCGSITEVFSRVCGYFRPVTQWNEGKVAEFSSRKYYTNHI